MANPCELFQEAIATTGMNPPPAIQDDGKLHRFNATGKRGNDSGWYVMHTDGVPAGAFGDWRTGISQQWSAKTPDAMTTAEREAHRQRLEAIKAQREADRTQRQQQAKDTALVRWNAATPAKEHNYLNTKGVQAYGVRIEGDNLLVPMRDTAGTLHSLQVIDPEGEKRFLSGARVKGCYHSIGKPSGELVICEGYATGASIHEATGYAVAVAFNAGNLPEVAQALHSKFPTLRLILAADDDWKTEGNPGLAKATEAAKAIGAAVAVPDFGANRPDRATDFNDLHQIAGISAVIQSIKAATTIDAPASKPRTEVMLLNGADLKPTPVSWLWRGWLALGKMHILAGAPGQGKTTIAIACGATVTIGGKWPDGSKSEKGNILIWSGEDDPADTLLPRLLAAGADKSRCYFVSGTRINGEIMPFDPARDMAALEAQAKHISGVRLLIVDPVVSAVTGDSHKNTEVRRALQPLVDLASRLNAAVIGISHFSKGTGSSDPASRVVGSIAFTAVARVVLVAAKVRDAQGNERRIFARGKSNIGADDGGFEYSIIQGEPLPGIEACYVAWGKAVEGTARELLAEPEQDDSGDKSVVDDAAEFLTQELADGTTPVKTLKANARDAGISWAAIRRASEGMPIIKTKAVGGWYWRMASHENSQHTLPAQGAQGAQDAQREHLEFDGKIQRNFNLLNTKNEHLDPKSTYFQGAQDVQREHLEHLEQAQRVDCFLSADDDSEVI